MNPGLLRMVADDKSSTGISAAILIRNIKPRKLASGDYRIAISDFTAKFKVDCDGYKVNPRVAVSILCATNPTNVASIQRRRRLERAMAGSPMLK